MKNGILITLLGLLLLVSVNGQAQASIQEEASVNSTINKFISLNNQTTSLKGWKIQIVTTNDRREMEQAIAKLNQKYPHLEYDWKHASPYYQLKVGAYEEKADLQNMLITLKQDFRSAIPVMDEVEKQDLVK